MAIPMVVPEVGLKSKPGLRWFVCGCGDFKITTKGQKMDRDTEGNTFVRKGEYIYFERQNKPDRFIGDGLLGNLNPGGKDLNSNRVWGVCKLDTRDPEDAKKADYLRKHAHYLHVQENKAFDVSKLKIIELDWDPGQLPSGAWINGGMVTRQEKVSKPESPAPEAPAEEQHKAQQGNVALMGRTSVLK